MSKPVVILAFPTELIQKSGLEYLNKEKDVLERLFEPYDGKQLKLVSRTNNTLASIAKDIRTFQYQVEIFHFAGHANNDKLCFADGDAMADKIAEKLKFCPNLKLIFLNGCATRRQVEHYRELPSRPLVIGTTAPVEDDHAYRFAMDFYEALCNEEASISDAFATATEGEDLKAGNLVRRAGRNTPSEELLKARYWLMNDPDQASLNWSLATDSSAMIEVAEHLKFRSNSHLRRTVFSSMKKHSERIRNIAEHLNAEDDNATQHQIIWENIPYPVGMLLRKLFATHGIDEEGEQFHKSSIERLKLCQLLFQRTMRFVAYVLLADLCQTVNEDGVHLSDAARASLLWLFPTEEQSGYSAQGYTEAIAHIITAFAENSLESSFANMTDLPKLFSGQNQLGNALEFLEDVSGIDLGTQALRETEVDRYCKMVEIAYSTVLCHFTWLCEYKILSVRHMRLLRNNSWEEDIIQPFFFNVTPQTLSAAPRRLNELGPDTELANLSVFLKGESDNLRLNITPFYLDVNSIISDYLEPGKKLKPRIYYLALQKKDYLLYRSLEKETDTFVIYPDKLEGPQINHIKREMKEIEARESTPYFDNLRSVLVAYQDRLLKNNA